MLEPHVSQAHTDMVPQSCIMFCVAELGAVQCSAKASKCSCRATPALAAEPLQAWAAGLQPGVLEAGSWQSDATSLFLIWQSPACWGPCWGASSDLPSLSEHPTGSG